MDVYSNRVILSCQYEAKYLSNVSSTLLNLYNEVRQLWRQKGFYFGTSKVHVINLILPCPQNNSAAPLAVIIQISLWFENYTCHRVCNETSSEYGNQTCHLTDFKNSTANWHEGLSKCFWLSTHNNGLKIDQSKRQKCWNYSSNNYFLFCVAKKNLKIHIIRLCFEQKPALTY